MSAARPPAAKPLEPGDAAPWFRAPAFQGSPTYAFDTAAGRPALLLFFGSAKTKPSVKALALVQANRALFDDVHTCFFGITCDPGDAAERRIAQQIPGIRFFLDFERKISRLYGAVPDAESAAYLPHWLLLDRALRVVERFDIEAGEQAIAALAAEAGRAPPDQAPVVTVPRVFEPALCRELIALYEKDGGAESGFMREVDGKTVLMTDPGHKQRRDYEIEDDELRRQLMTRIRRRLVPMVRRAFQFDPTRVERHIVSCYSAGAGHFKPHRDNTTKGTAHRRFAVTINLNDGYEGGDLRFPEFGPRTYRAPVGGAIVFSCSLLHEATPVTQGDRYAYLPFLYDEEAARQREANNPHLGEGTISYQAGEQA